MDVASSCPLLRLLGAMRAPCAVIAFLGLAVVGCGEADVGTARGTGGTPGTGGNGSGGATSADAASRGGAGGSASGGTVGTGGAAGAPGTGGTTSVSGGRAGGGGAMAAGGATSAGGTGGPAGTGGSTGGTTGTGGTTATGGGPAGRDGGSADATSDGSVAETSGSGGLRTGGAGGGTGGGGGGGTGGPGTRPGGSGGQGTGGSPAKITVWLAGDSTVANGSTPCPVGWGKPFQSLFGADVTVTNSAQGGRSVQTWLFDVSTTMGGNGECVLNSDTYLSAWTTMLGGMKSGDYLFVQFGINDGDRTCNRHVGTALFQTYYGMMAEAAKDRGANPIFVTPVSSIACSGNQAVGTRGAYADATKSAGATYGVPVIDLEQLSVALYTSLGFCPLPGPDTATTFQSGAIGDFFCEDHTHFEAAGAAQIAALIAKALRDQGIGLAGYLK
jgi:lysophospholipase L1-like esterase